MSSSRRNLATRMGRWSACHWKTAVVGWLTLVAAAFVIGGQLGTRELTDAQSLTGESRLAQELLDGAASPSRPQASSSSCKASPCR